MLVAIGRPVASNLWRSLSQLTFEFGWPIVALFHVSPLKAKQAAPILTSLHFRLVRDEIRVHTLRSLMVVQNDSETTGFECTVQNTSTLILKKRGEVVPGAYCIRMSHVSVEQRVSDLSSCHPLIATNRKTFERF